MSGQITRLYIEAYTSSKFDKKIGEGVFYVQANPETYAISYAVDYKGRQGRGTSSFDPKWDKTPPRKLTFEFLFDSTGAIPAFDQVRMADQNAYEIITKDIPGETIESKIEHLEYVVFKIDGKNHKPNHLLIVWGSLVFGCCLESMNVNYKLFDNQGAPIRATVNATFVEVNRDAKRIYEDRFQSPDITHAFTVKEGDTLPLMAENVYGDTAYYIAVAQANKLIQFRNLKAGKQIVFPPINKPDA